MGRGGYLGIRGYRGLAVVDVATIGRSDSLLEQGPHIWWDMVKWGLNCNYIPIHFFGGVWYGIHTTSMYMTHSQMLGKIEYTLPAKF